ncbi:SDR family oxidoreductase [Brevibacterium daeguense]|uniref:SDR family oxidoreductase n=1 Tax=Brevibacterium daeguense TaxID=909936 RepID=A0ABP8EGF0_9MICO|nr:SDR family oxidoreductase [Brevibacterium daeguense]
MADFNDLTGQVAVVTGGNNGIGLGMARGLAQSGASVAIWGRNAERNAQAEAELSEFSKAKAFACDVADRDQVAEAMAGTIEEFGRVDSLIANAGIGGKKGPFHEMEIQEFHGIASVNVDGVVLSFQAAIKEFLKQESGGSLVAVSSLAGIEGAGTNIHYGATKGAVLAIMRGVAAEYGRYNIRANAILPGWIDTDMTEGAVGSEVFWEKVIKRVPIRRWGKPEDFAAAAVYLAGPGSKYTSGQQFVIDGGYSIF